VANSISFSGLGSGLDTNKIVDQLVAIEKAPIGQLNQRKSETSKRLSIVGELISKLQALRSSALSLDASDKVTSLSATSSDSTRVKVSASSSASPGVYNLRVDRLAQAETTRSRSFSAHDTPLPDLGALDLSVGGDSPITIHYDGSDTLDDVAARINASGVRASAQVLFDGSSYRLNVTAKDTGMANALSFGGTGDLLGFTDAGAEVVSAQDAQVTLSGTTITRSSNTITDVIPGVTLDLMSETPASASTTQLTIARDPAALRGKVQGLVDAYNKIAQVVGAQLQYVGDGKTQKGADTLFGDPTVMSLQRELASVVTRFYANGTGTTSTGQLGISLGRDGQLTLDPAKFDAAVAKDPAAINNLLAGTNHDGLAATIGSLVDRYTSSTTGLLVGKQKSLTSLNRSYDQQIDRLSDAAESLGTRLRKQFVAMEATISKLNSQQGYIDKIFSVKSDD
jgi:flagellar hook-associated protein 2